MGGVHVEVSPGATASAHSHDTAACLPLVQSKGTVTTLAVVLEGWGRGGAVGGAVGGARKGRGGGQRKGRVKKRVR